MKKSTRLLLLCFFTLLLAFSLWRLWGIFTAYREGKDHYNTLEQYVSISEDLPSGEETIPSVPISSGDPAVNNTIAAETVDVSAWPQVDFFQLAQINSDIVGWIYIEGTNVNYPIVQAENNRYYLNRLFDGSYNASGCIFLDCRSSSDFSDRHSIIYGHHMKDNSMFAGLMQYKQQAFFDEHPVALLVTPEAYYKIQFFSGYVSDTWSDAWDLSFHEHEYISWLRNIQEKSCFEAESLPGKKDRIITLSTCTYEFDTAKFVLHGYISESIKNTSLAK